MSKTNPPSKRGLGRGEDREKSSTSRHRTSTYSQDAGHTPVLHGDGEAIPTPLVHPHTHASTQRTAASSLPRAHSRPHVRAATLVCMQTHVCGCTPSTLVSICRGVVCACVVCTSRRRRAFSTLPRGRTYFHRPHHRPPTPKRTQHHNHTRLDLDSPSHSPSPPCPWRHTHAHMHTRIPRRRLSRGWTP